MLRRLMTETITLSFIGLLGLVWVYGQAVAADPLELDVAYVSEDGAFHFNYPSTFSLTITEQCDNRDIGIFYLGESPIWLEVILPADARRYAIRSQGNTSEEIVIGKIEQWEANAPIMLANIVGDQVTPEFAAKNARVTAFEVDGKQGYYATQVYEVDGEYAAAVMVAAVDLGDDYVVTVAASAQLKDGAVVLEQHIEAVLAVLGTMEYAPPDVPPPDLTKAYTGSIGLWQTGTLAFSYPSDWYTATLVGNLFLANTAAMALGSELPPGQLSVRFVAPDYNMTAFEPEENIRGCSINGTAITAMRVIETQLLGDNEAGLQERGVLYSEPRVIEMPNHDIVEMWLFTAKNDMLVLAVDMGAGNVVSMSIFSHPGEMDEYETILLSIADSLTYTPDGCE